ncbi:O-acetyl-ADP-ribose deacetylase [Sediminispirochaeta bajacaliforniensis]|uniref:O-acetyl-ADP-ribose deacetylase n=1 Tax=Sediminispirochaeta bajacaliforniensis TaxID=148 RepID=UPI00037AC887|nr:O-acetyl-ADP-ribose deacetylase [Sediminispirochaeta bajacaliforniensis]
MIEEIKSLAEGRIIVCHGDITTFKGDAIVNAANSTLLGGGGVDGAIHRAGGPEILAECKRIRSERLPGGLPPGEAVLTGAGKLPTQKIIHTVGPIWHGGKQGEKETLSNAYRNALRLAADSGVERVAFPAISTGVYGFPKKLAASIVYDTVTDFLRHEQLPHTVFLLFFGREDAELFLREI